MNGWWNRRQPPPPPPARPKPARVAGRRPRPVPSSGTRALRGRPGTPLRIEHQLPPIDVRPDRWQKAGVVGTIINSLTVIAVATGLWITYQSSHDSAQLDRQAQISDRFTKAIEQLGSAQLDIRLGGIWGLARLM